MALIQLKPFIDAVNEHQHRLRELHIHAYKFLGYFCTYTPIELLHAAGFVPIRVVGGAGRADKADLLTPNFICPYMRMALDKGLKGEYDFISGLVNGYTCDAACGLMNIWKENLDLDFCCTLPLPYSDSRDARKLFRSEIRCLTENLNDIGGRFTDDALNKSLELYSGIRSVILDLYNMHFNGKLPFSAWGLHQVVFAGFVTPPEDFLKMLKKLTEDIKNMKIERNGGVPLMLSGSVIEDPIIFKLISDCGGKVVADDLCSGYRNFYPAEGRCSDPFDPVERMIDRYISRFPCPARARAVVRASAIAELIDRSGSRGVVFIFQKFCTPHLADLPIISEYLKKQGIPGILIELEETGIAEGQIRTRLEGFIEMLR